MGKIQPTPSTSFRAVQSVRKTIEHPSLSEPIILHFFPLDDLRRMKADGIAEELTRRYVDGGWYDESGKYQKQPDIYPPVAEVAPELSAKSLEIMARIEAMQDPAKGDVYTVLEDLIPWAVVNREVFLAFQAAASEAMDDGAGKEAGKPVLATITTG